MTERLYPESVVKELLNQLRENCIEAAATYRFDSAEEARNYLSAAPTPNMEGGIEIPTIDDIKAVAISQTIYEKNTSIYIIDNFRRKFEQGANYIIKSLTPPTNPESQSGK